MEFDRLVKFGSIVVLVSDCPMAGKKGAHNVADHDLDHMQELLKKMGLPYVEVKKSEFEKFNLKGRTALLVLTVTAASVAIAVPVAWLTVRTDLPLRRLWAVLTALPLVIPSYVAGFLIVLALGPRGTLQGLLEPLGVERLPDIHGFTGAALTLTLLSYPYVLLPVRAALSRMDPSLEESSRGLGQGAWTTFLRVTLPMLRPAIVAVALAATFPLCLASPTSFPNRVVL